MPSLPHEPVPVIQMHLVLRAFFRDPGVLAGGFAAALALLSMPLQAQPQDCREQMVATDKPGQVSRGGDLPACLDEQPGGDQSI